ncbi:hypothetical protein FSARC_3971 [Fusarium sarcochroum]|uniref:Zn(2)-C6 fungal-type domain-containing protein n=1 Tax=Fusarium sarcochroum TaxID=1208366 RepID=A0A8H4U2I6_9HYPO|nr:hypothetical protein FSARC_3971 [Fusarium sarcochroum]
MSMPFSLTTEGGDQLSGAKRRRAYHKKSRAGCKTCKTRRVRCDETKPSCQRCMSSGRACEGYRNEIGGSPAEPSLTLAQQSTIPGNIVVPPKLLIPRKNPDEIRSYNYFLEVTGPALAGLFDADFWCRELPKICVADPALWHAVVALGSVHEACGYGDRQPETKPQYKLCLQQYSAAVSSLRDTSAHRSTDRWRAIIASTIFTCIYVMQGLYKQALAIHAAAGCNLIREIETEQDANRPQPITRDQHDTLSSAPIDLRQVKDLLLDFEMLAQTLKTGGYSDDRNAESLSRTDSYGYWRFYKSPDICPESPRHLVAAFLTRARRAAESLQNSLGLWWQENRDDIHGLYSNNKDTVMACYEKLLARQIAHTRCYKELQRTLRKFQKYFNSEAFATKLIIVELLQLTNSLYLLSDPEQPDPIIRQAKMPLVADRIVEISENILAWSSSSPGKLSLAPAPLTSGPLFLVATSGFSQSSRKRAMELLGRPRLEGFWEPAMSASLAEAMWMREEELWKLSQSNDKFAPAEESEFGCVHEEMPLPYRVCSAKLQFSNKKREALVTMMTQIEEENGIAPVQRTIHW